MDTRRRYEAEPEIQISLGKFFGWGTGVIAFIGLVVIWMGIFTTAQYERAVVTRQGAFNRIAQPGLNLMIPFVDSREEIDMRVRTVKFFDMEAYSADQQIAKLDISVTFEPRESKLEYLYNKHRTIKSAIDSLFKPYMPTHTKVVFGRYTATSAIRDREKLNFAAKNEILASLGTDSVFNILSVNIEDVEFSKKYNESVEARMHAEVEVLKTQQNWEREKVSADIIKTQADAIAYQIKTRGDAEAAAIEAKTKALANNPKYVEMIQAEKWDGKLPTTMLPSGAVPMLTMPSSRQ